MTFNRGLEDPLFVIYGRDLRARPYSFQSYLTLSSFSMVNVF
jgi:hypothetical protein